MSQKSRVKKLSKQTSKNHKQLEHPEKQQQNQQKEQKFSLYLFLQVQRTASQDQIKKQYRKLVLKYHPDKNQGDPTAKEKFQKLKQAFDILSDPQKRKMYDETGTLGCQDEFDEKGFQSAYEYFRALYKKVTEEDIDDFSKRYRFGQMEQEDLIDFYQQHKGNMTQLIESIPLSSNEDIPRFIKFFQSKIQDNTLEKYKSFEKTKNKVRLLKDETEQFQEFQKEKKKSQFQQLALAIRNKKSQHQDFLTALEEKYGGGKKKKAEKSLPKQGKKSKKVPKKQ